jgi:hypothetical protein
MIGGRPKECQSEGVSEQHLPRDELRATIDARRDLGPEYESALVESFLERIDATIEQRVQAEVGRRVPQAKPSGSSGEVIWLALGSMGLGIPLTAIASEKAGTVGLLLVWIGIVLVNLAAALSRIGRR